MIPTPEDARRTLEKILSRPEFTEEGTDLAWLEALRLRVLGWLEELFHFGNAIFSPETARLQAILFTIVLATTALAILRLAIGPRRRGASARPADSWGDVVRAAGAAEEDAEALLAAGDTGGAVRVAFGAFLARLGARVREDLSPYTPREVILRSRRWSLPAATQEALPSLASEYARVRYAGEFPETQRARNYLAAARAAL